MAVKVVVLLAVFLAGFVASRTIGVAIKFNSIKPLGNTALTDEQQGILAVRSVKAAVVSVIGNTKDSELHIQTDSIFGTGFIVSSDGYILTNSHVVADSSAGYSALLLDGKKLPVTVVGTDAYDDVALLKVDGINMATVKFGDSDNLETGQTVFAIGNALGRYQNSVTRGVVSGIGRSVVIGSPSDPKPRFQNLIQTDAAINRGNSGGPVITLAGEVVGMSTVIDQGGEGLGFAIPGNSVQLVMDQLRKYGKVNRPYLGVNFGSIDPRVKAANGLSVDQGAYVVSVVPGSSADRAGVKPGDVIVSFDGKTITKDLELDTVLLSYVAGNQVFLEVLRGTEHLQLLAILGEYK